MRAAFRSGERISSIEQAKATREIPKFSVIGMRIEKPLDFVKVLLPLRSPYFETVKVAILDPDGRIIHSQVLYAGTLDTAAIDLRDLMLLHQKYGHLGNRLLISHNHPGGDPSPSEADIRMQSYIERLSSRAGFDVIDHVITDGNRFYSFKEQSVQPIPADMMQPAEWEVVPRHELTKIDNPTTFQGVVGTLRQVNPSMAHLLFTNTRDKLLAIHRVEANRTSIFKALLAGIGSEGAANVLIDFGPAVDPNTALNSVREYTSFLRGVTSTQIRDWSSKDVLSARMAGVFEDQPRGQARKSHLLESYVNPLATSKQLLAEHPSEAVRSADRSEIRLRLNAMRQSSGLRPRLNDTSQAGFTTLPRILADLLVVGARVLRRGGQWTMTRAQWVASMVRQFGESIRRHLDATWTQLMRLQNQVANGLSATAQGMVNAVEVLSGRTNIPAEQHPAYDPETLAKGRPSLGTRLAPALRQIRILSGRRLELAKRRRDVEEATQTAAVRKQADALWKQLVETSAKANSLSQWKLPAWMIGTPRAKRFAERALHIAARLNATGRDAAGNFVFAGFTQRMGSMTPAALSQLKLTVGDTFTDLNPNTGEQETWTVGPLVTTPEGRVFHQLLRDIQADAQAELYRHYASEYPDLIWFLDMFIDPALKDLRVKINGVEVPVFNRFAQAAMMAEADPNFTPLSGYTPDVLVTRSLLGSIRGTLSFQAGTRSPGRRYKSGATREGGHVRDLLSGFNVRTWQMLAERSRKEWHRAVMDSAVPLKTEEPPPGYEKVGDASKRLWKAIRKLKHWRSPETWRPLKQSEIDDLDILEEKLQPHERIARKDGKLYLVSKVAPETEDRLTARGVLDEEHDYRKFHAELFRLEGKGRKMLPSALVDQLVRRYTAQVEHGMLYRLGAWGVRNSTRLFLVAPTTYVANVLTNDVFTVEAGVRRILSGIVGRNAQDLRFARELAIGEFWKWFPGLRSLVDTQFRDTVTEVLPDAVFSDQTALADLKMRMDESPWNYLRQGEIGAAALNWIRYGNIDVRSKQRMAYAWLKAKAVTDAKAAGLKGQALQSSVARYLQNPPIADRAQAVEVAAFELLNYSDSPAWLDDFASNDFSKLLLPFPRFGYHYLAKNAVRAAALRDLLAKVPKQKRADAFADVVTFLMFPAGGAGILTAGILRALGADDEDDARKLVGTSFIKRLDDSGNVVTKPIDRALITVNRMNLSGWARGLGLGTNREEDFWLRVRNYPVVAMAGAAIMAENDARKFGAKEGAKSYLNMVGDLASDFFSLGMAGKVPAKAIQEFMGQPGDKVLFDPYARNVPLLAYLTDQTIDSFVPGVRQADLVIRWLDPVQRRRTASKQLGFDPGVWDAARVGHVTGLLDRVLSGGASTLPPEGRVDKHGDVSAQEYPQLQRVMELAGFNVRPVNRAAYESALQP